MEVDYTEKLNFSDDEENQAAKDKRDNWWVFNLSDFHCPVVRILSTYYSKSKFTVHLKTKQFLNIWIACN